jgi:putative transposase
LDDENRRLKKLLAEQMLDNAALRLYREEELAVRRRRGRKRALGTRAPLQKACRPNLIWVLDFQRGDASGRSMSRTSPPVKGWPPRPTPPCPAIGELDAIVAERGRPEMIVSETSNVWSFRVEREFCPFFGLNEIGKIGSESHPINSYWLPAS